MVDWNDIRYFLAVADTGSTLAAGRALKVSQTTAARRIAALEDALQVALFDRSPGGYRLTEAGADLLVHARAVQRTAQALSDAAAAQQREVSGTVRVTAQEILAVTILSPILRDLHQAYPAIMIDLDTSEEVRDLAAGAADIALRHIVRPTGAGLVGRRLADDHWTLYCSRSYAAEHGYPRRRSEVAGHPLVGGGENGLWRLYREWLQKNGLEASVVMHHSSAMGLLAAVRSDVGLAVLPCLIADNDPDLVRCLPPMPESPRGIWLLTHERLRHTPRVRVVLEFLAERLTRLARTQSGGAGYEAIGA
ncbi:LysR family transcriptional regulator [Sphingomonas sp. So64.6b]|uniref:LysR family transcriptional regulator n=1 Tax=Sphingomonas sp. So64.6b TaxID=2997354 RepID=UPI0015FEE196|nr:LysR family transcriptional regulator [Sphingomonas sp. So64.6b]QNA83039.1 LysR family transcriptional regulator [Sphingomonas sp. So64.6b]